MAYCVVATDLKPYLKIPAATTTDDALLTQLVTRAQAMIDKYCDRTFEASADSTKYLDAVDDVEGAILHLGSAGDLCAITSVTNGDDEVLAATDYVTEPRGSTPYRALRLLASSDVSWTYDEDHENAITIVGKWAYSATAPADITHACIRLAAWLYRQKDTTDNSADRPLLAGDGTIVMPTSFPNDVLAILKPYRRLV